MEFVNLLYQIDSELDHSDVQSLKFLCIDLLSSKKLSKIESGRELFDQLMQNGFIDKKNHFLLAELLYIIGQHCLLKVLDYNKVSVQELLPTHGKTTLYRRMLFEISENVTTEDLKDIMFLLEIKKKQKESRTFLDLLSYLEKKEIISEDNLKVLEGVFEKVSPDVLKIIDNYKNEKAQQSQGIPEPNINRIEPEDLKTPLSIQALSHLEKQWPNDDTRTESVREHIQLVRGEAEREDDNIGNLENKIHMLRLNQHARPGTSAEDDLYAMNSTHRGYCLIISNLDFMHSSSRQGTEKDEEELRNVFKWLGLDVETHNEQSAENIHTCMKDFASRDHSERDCFVCCIMTHGESGMILGNDNVTIPINDIITYFIPDNCPTLCGKPKLFFIQACQGKKSQDSYPIQDDASVSPRKYVIKIPTDADLLIGMSTVDGYYSYRHVKYGTWYIQAVCKNLAEMVPRGEDILSILTKVNNDVSLKEDQEGNRKQMPQPTYTLRKKLIFPAPSTPYTPKKP
ncbi:caspase-8-like isoform X2 [Spea bombifrons]|uniref:caspase-8-like isoform X2 n=1 Tax=Spea bombifrons TaxID=233779 RepID=UPI002348FC3D|nr:caspase-8-like isoform X2 [Spea bombifrons]